MIHSKRDERMVLVNKVAGIIQQRMKEANIKGEIKGGPNTLFNIQKDEEAGQNLRSDIRPCSGKGDCGNNRDCYTVLGDIHSIWKPIPGRFKII